VAWNAYHSGTVPHMKHQPSFKRFLRALVPPHLPNTRELGRKIDSVMYALKRKYQHNAALAAAAKGE